MAEISAGTNQDQILVESFRMKGPFFTQSCNMQLITSITTCKYVIAERHDFKIPVGQNFVIVLYEGREIINVCISVSIMFGSFFCLLQYRKLHFTIDTFDTT